MASVQEPIELHYKDLIDMALGSTDIGLFNLHLLHTILRCLVVHLNLDTTIIEYNGTQRGQIENFFTNRASLSKQTIVEKVETEGDVVPTSTEGDVMQTTQINLVVKDYDREENPCGNYPSIPGKMISRSLPKCKDLLAALKCNTNATENPIGKMVDLINLTERMTAAEIAIEKLSSLINDLMKKNQALSDLLDEKNQQIASLVERLATVEHEAKIKFSAGSESGGSAHSIGDESSGGTYNKAVSGIGSKSPDASHGGIGLGSADGKGGGSGPDSDKGLGGSHRNVDGSHTAADGSHKAADGIHKAGDGYSTGDKSTSGKGGGSDANRVGGEGTDGRLPGSPTRTGDGSYGAGGESLGDALQAIDGANISSQGSGTHLISEKPGEGMVKDDSVVALFIRSQSADFDKIFDQKKDDIFKAFEDMFNCSGGIATGKMLKHAERELLRKLHLFKSMVFERLIAVECDLSRTQKQVKHINDNVEDLLDLFARLKKKVDHLDEFEKSSIEQFAIIQKNINCLMGEREVRRRQIYDIIESIEMVKTIKANKNDLDLLDLKKADKDYADSKVSIKKFNIIQNDLACSIIQTMEKNSAQDIDMANAVKRIETIINEKIDKIEHKYTIATITKRIDEISDKLNAMIKLRVCPEGAGTVQMLKNVRCITCNDTVQMKMEEGNTLPCTAVLKTKHQFALQVETECRTGTKPKLTEILRSRYCGGEYTMMEANEKVPQKTDFYIDANVCPPPMSDVYYIEGNDGALYRAQPPECAFKNTNSSHIIKRSPSK